jgi:Na+/melibiose symporter-like transporter
VAALNGAPLGAKFLADSILADIIDYDEFLTGQRREATYFMFKSFLPKVVMIPASALPIAFLGIFGYRSPVGGKPALQPDAVAWYIKGAIFMGFVASVISTFIKSRYPMREEDVSLIRSGIELQKEGKAAPDPLRNNQPTKPIEVPDGPPLQLYFIFGHFNAKYLQKAFALPDEYSRTFPPDVPAGAAAMKRLTLWQLVGAMFVILLSAVATAVSLPLLEDKDLQFIPTMLVVFGGFALTALCALILRRRAALEFEKMVKDGTADEKFIERLIRHEEFVHYEAEELPGEASEDFVERKGLLAACCRRGDVFPNFFS